MRSVFLGPPGAGKGTQARMIAADGTVLHLSTGDLLREEVNAGSALGLKAKRFMDDGKLVPDELVFEILFAKLGLGKGMARAFILDGFPRTRAQALELDRRLAAVGLPLVAVVNFVTSEDAAVARLSSRLVCRNCQAAYNARTARPARDGICDRCGGELYRRHDDDPDVVRVRFQEYRQKSAELVAYYQQSGLLRNVDAELPVAEVVRQLRQQVFAKK
ncbi:MAG: nucleoside monophosphate kinase [Planctomycetota bacterium]